jgi:hypothetical protein
MLEVLFILLIAPFIGGGLIYLLLLMADALISAAGDFIGE